MRARTNRVVTMVAVGVLAGGGVAADVDSPSAAASDSRQSRTLEMSEAGLAVTFPAEWRLWSTSTSRTAARSDEAAIVASDVRRRSQCTVSLMEGVASADAMARETYADVDAHPQLDATSLDFFSVPAGDAARVVYRLGDGPDAPRLVRNEYFVSAPGGVVSVSCSGDDPQADGWRHVVESLTPLPVPDQASAPFDARVVGPDARYAVELPAEWLVRPWGASGPLFDGRVEWRAVTLGDDGGAGGYECIVEDATGLRSLADVDSTEDWRAALATSADAGGEQAPIVTDTDLESSAGRVPRADWEGWRGIPASAWLFAEDERRVILLCRSDDPPPDRWLSVAETFEFLSEE